jgi:diaminopimelate epimerase
VRRGLSGSLVAVVVDGGELEIEYRAPTVLMTGPVAIAFRGTIDLSAYPA